MLRKLLILVLTVAMVGVGVVLWGATAARVSAGPTDLTAMKARVTLKGSRTAVWNSVMTPQGLCRYVIYRCEDVRVSGSTRYAVRLNLRLPPAEVHPWVNVQVTKQVPRRMQRLRLVAKTPTGRFDAALQVRLTGSAFGPRTVLTTRVLSAHGTGITGRAAMQQLRAWPALVRSSASNLNAMRREAQATLLMNATTKARRVTVRPEVTYASGLSPTPQSTGTIRVYRNGSIVCAKRLRQGKALCTMRKPAKGARLSLVATGTLGNGYPMWHTASRRYQP